LGSPAKQRKTVAREVGIDPIASTPDGWFKATVHKFFGWFNKLRQFTVQGMTASNSTHMRQHDDEDPDNRGPQ